MKAGELARKAQINVETLRFYESKGLLPKPRRSASGYRTYDDGAVARILFIKKAQQLGFTLNDAKALIQIAEVRPGPSCGRVKKLALAKVADIEAKIADLQVMHRSLKELVASCEEGRPTCGLLDNLAGREA